MINKKLLTLKIKSELDFLLSSGQEFGDLSSLKPPDQTQILKIFAEIKEKGYLLEFFNLGLERIFSNYAQLPNLFFGSKSREREFQRDKAKIDRKNELLTQFLKKMAKDNNFTLINAGDTAFFKNRVNDTTLFHGIKSHAVPDMINNLIDIFEHCPTAMKTEFFTSFCKQKISKIYYSEMLGFFNENYNSARFKNNFNFSKDFLAFIVKEMAKCQSDQSLNKKTFETNFQQMLDFGLDIKSILPVYLSHKIEISENPLDIDHSSVDINLDCYANVFDSNFSSIIEQMLSANEAVNSILSKTKTYNIVLSEANKQKLINLSAYQIGIATFVAKETFSKSSIVQYFNQDLAEKNLYNLRQALEELELIEKSLDSKSDKKWLIKNFKPSWSPAKVMKKIVDNFLDSAHDMSHDEGGKNYKTKQNNVINFFETFLEKIELENVIVSGSEPKTPLLKI